MKIETQYTHEITCPHCFHVHGDSWDKAHGEMEFEMNCNECGKGMTVLRTIITEYSTTPKARALRNEDLTPEEEQQMLEADPDYCICDRCGGEGWIEYNDGDGSDWGEDCPSEENRLITCRQCHGTGKA